MRTSAVNTVLLGPIMQYCFYVEIKLAQIYSWRLSQITVITCIKTYFSHRMNWDCKHNPHFRAPPSSNISFTIWQSFCRTFTISCDKIKKNRHKQLNLETPNLSLTVKNQTSNVANATSNKKSNVESATSNKTSNVESASSNKTSNSR